METSLNGMLHLGFNQADHIIAVKFKIKFQAYQVDVTNFPAGEVNARFSSATDNNVKSMWPLSEKVVGNNISRLKSDPSTMYQ
jgi:hypothetical protein